MAGLHHASSWSRSLLTLIGLPLVQTAEVERGGNLCKEPFSGHSCGLLLILDESCAVLTSWKWFEVSLAMERDKWSWGSPFCWMWPPWTPGVSGCWIIWPKADARPGSQGRFWKSCARTAEETASQRRPGCFFKMLQTQIWGFPQMGVPHGTPKLSIYRWIFPYRQSSCWGTPIYGTPHPSYESVSRAMKKCAQPN